MKNWYAYSMIVSALGCAGLAGALAMHGNPVAAGLYVGVAVYVGIRALLSYRRPE